MPRNCGKLVSMPSNPDSVCTADGASATLSPSASWSRPSAGGFHLPETSVLPMKSILIADGDERVAHMFARVFASHGWNVTRHSDGHLAGEDLEGPAHYDAVVVGY